jgi:hypothetical protein
LGIARMPDIVPVSYLCWSVSGNSNAPANTHPNNRPPKATNRPITIAGHAAPGSSDGLLKRNPIVTT